jgi:hypothetical protein
MSPPDVLVPPWKTLNGDITSKPGERSLLTYRDVLAQFKVQTNPRYTPHGGTTYCNIYVWDCTRALGCEVPHWVGPAGQAVPPGRGSETTANALLPWFIRRGAAEGWKEVYPQDAYPHVQEGRPCVAQYAAPKGHGHIAMVLPGPNGTLHVAQAGGQCLFDVPLIAGFRSCTPRFFIHD